MTRVLVIDDDKSICIAIEIYLRHHNCLAVLADSGHLGTKMLAAGDFDVVMVDIFMPGMDGFQTIRDIRGRAPTMPIVAMSGFRFRNSMAPALDFLGMAGKLGATYTLRKPFTPQQLMAGIDVCLDKRLPIYAGA